MEFHNFTWFVYTIRLVLYLQKKVITRVCYKIRSSTAEAQVRVRNNHQEKKIIIEKNKQMWILWQSYFMNNCWNSLLEGGIKWQLFSKTCHPWGWSWLLNDLSLIFLKLIGQFFFLQYIERNLYCINFFKAFMPAFLCLVHKCHRNNNDLTKIHSLFFVADVYHIAQSSKYCLNLNLSMVRNFNCILKVPSRAIMDNFG